MEVECCNVVPCRQSVSFSPSKHGPAFMFSVISILPFFLFYKSEKRIFTTGKKSLHLHTPV